MVVFRRGGLILDWTRRAPLARLTVFDLFGNPEIGNLDPALVIHQNIGSLDIPMDDIALVQVIQPRQDLPDEILDEGFFKCAVIVQ